MARRAPGLGKGLGDILKQYPAEPPAPTTSKPPVGWRSVLDSSDDFVPTCVGMANEYYQGPRISTRVAGHQFIPTESAKFDWILDNPVDRNVQSQFYGAIEGHIYVLWQSDGKVTRYGPCTLSDYRAFRVSNSKGRSVKWLEGFGKDNNWPIEDTDLGQCSPSLSRMPRKR